MGRLEQFCVIKGKLLYEERIKENKYICGETGWNIIKVIHALMMVVRSQYMGSWGEGMNLKSIQEFELMGYGSRWLIRGRDTFEDDFQALDLNIQVDDVALTNKRRFWNC